MTALIAVQPLYPQAGDLADEIEFGFPVARAALAGTEPRSVALAGTRLTIPGVASALQSEFGRLATTLEIANISDADAHFSLRLRGLDGQPLGMPFFDPSCPSCTHTRLMSAVEATVAPGTAYRVEIAAADPLRLGWAEFESDSNASFSVSAMLEVTDTDGTIELIGIPAASTVGEAWLYVDTTRLFSTELILVNPSPRDTQAIQLHYRNSADKAVECRTTVEIAPSGGALLTVDESLPCSSNSVGLVEMRGEEQFTGVAVVSMHAGGIFSRQFAGKAPPRYPALSQWAVSAGQVGFGSSLSGGCVTLADTQVEGTAYTVHTSKWQRRAHPGDAWTDVPGTGRTGQVCPYTPTERGEYRAIAEITIGNERGVFASSDILTVVQPAGSLPVPVPDLQEFTSSAGMQFVRIPAGVFSMGSTGAWANASQSPLTLVTISEAFWIGKHEVTQGQWEAVMGSNPSHFGSCGSDCPVESVSWDDSQLFIQRLNEMEGETRYRLPTEAEWEYAARGGSESDTYAGDLTLLGRSNAPLLDGIAWYGGNSGVEYEGGEDCSEWRGKQYPSRRCGPQPVGRKAPNQYGLHDMLGNVWEWTWDRFGEYPGGEVTDPVGAESGEHRTIRSCGWTAPSQACLSAGRFRATPDWSGYNTGLRVVRSDNVIARPATPEDDHGNDRATATYMDLWIGSSGAIEVPEDQDYFRFVVPDRSDLGISVTTGRHIVKVTVYDGSGRIVESDGGPFLAGHVFYQTVDGGTYYVRVESARGRTGAYNVNPETYEPGPSSGGGTAADDQYQPLENWTVSDGRVQFFLGSAGRCVEVGTLTINGVSYTVHTSKWQRRADASSAWMDIPGTERSGQVCSYSPTESGQYRGVAEISIGGTRGMYSTKNVLTSP